jgi:hypothetical protein
VEQRNAAMPDMPIHNETEYTLTASILDQIKRDAIEYFGESVHSIRVQYGIERHAFNAKTGEVRYAFSPGDYGLVDTTSSFPEPYHRTVVIPSIDDEHEVLAEEPFEDEDVEVEDEETASFEVIEDDIEPVEDEDEDEGPDFQSLDEDFESMEDEEGAFLYDDEDDYD